MTLLHYKFLREDCGFMCFIIYHYQVPKEFAILVLIQVS